MLENSRQERFFKRCKAVIGFALAVCGVNRDVRVRTAAGSIETNAGRERRPIVMLIRDVEDGFPRID